MGGGCCIGNCCIKNCCVIDLCCIFDKPKGGGGGGYVPPTDQNSDASTVVKMQEALANYKTYAEEKCTKIEKEVIDASREHLDAFIDDMNRYNKIKHGNRKLNINIRNIERENRKTEDTIHGFIVSRVSKRVSFDDVECTEIMKMEAGEEKEKKFDDFYIKVLKEAVNELSDELVRNMEKQTDNICDRIQQRLDNIVDVCEAKTAEFENISKVKESDEDKIEQEQIRLTNIVAMCDLALDIIG